MNQVPSAEEHPYGDQLCLCALGAWPGLTCRTQVLIVKACWNKRRCSQQPSPPKMQDDCKGRGLSQPLEIAFEVSALWWPPGTDDWVVPVLEVRGLWSELFTFLCQSWAMLKQFKEWIYILKVWTAELFSCFIPKLAWKSHLAGSDNQKILLQDTVRVVSYSFFSMLITALQTAYMEIKEIAISSLIVGIIVVLRKTKLRRMNCSCIIQTAALTRLNVRLHLMVRVSQSQNLELHIDSESI